MNEIKRLNDEMTIRESEWKTKKLEFESYKNRALQVFQVRNGKKKKSF